MQNAFTKCDHVRACVRVCGQSRQNVKRYLQWTALELIKLDITHNVSCDILNTCVNLAFDTNWTSG